MGGAPEKDPRAAVATWVAIFGNPLTWDDLPWLRSLTKLPLIVKGICHPDDARRAIDGGVDGIYCSNHGRDRRYRPRAALSARRSRSPDGGRGYPTFADLKPDALRRVER
jgi:isopentenyl diphosphate isomerase/L-lactate dehydrogenase-like FMN-dependent dehydrogenase